MTNLKITDFEYDSLSLKEMGYVICSFEDKGDGVEANPAKLNFNMVKTNFGMSNFLTDTTYEEPLSSTFQICKNTCLYDSLVVTEEDIREINRWLSRKKMQKIKLVSTENNDYYTNASFNVSCIYYEDICYGFQIEIQTDKPYLLGEKIVNSFEITSSNNSYEIIDESDEVGCVDALVEVKINKSGNLTITNSYNDKSTVIKNCISGETITINNPTISTTNNSSHEKITNDFNWVFVKIGNEYWDKENKLTFSLPCSVKISYFPIIKLNL